MTDSPSLQEIAQRLAAPHKGILAADESLGTIEKRFTTIGLPSSDENRRAYRELLFTTPEIEQYLGGVILFDDTIRQSSSDGISFPSLLTERGIIPGIKPDKGGKPLPFFPDETVTEGHDGLRARLKEYFDLGARFTKWRGIFSIGDGRPSDYAIRTNADGLARFAALSQEAGLVPIVEPEVLLDGSHDILASEQATRRVLDVVFSTLQAAKVELSGMVLKPNFVTAGLAVPESQQASDEEVAERTVTLFRAVVPEAVPSIVMISGGQSPVVATRRLNQINRIYQELPWQLSFSYGRALQGEAIETWQGDPANVPAAQQSFLHRLKLVAAARNGNYIDSME